MEWVLIEGGVVQDSSKGVTYFDLDFMDHTDWDYITRWEVDDAEDILQRMEDYAGGALDTEIERVRHWIHKAYDKLGYDEDMRIIRKFNDDEE